MLSARTLVPWSALYPFGGAIFPCAHILPGDAASIAAHWFASGSAAKSGDTSLIRWFASGSAAKSGDTSLKSQLRALYRLVHPDLFHDAQVEKETNEVSFKALQEYLNADDSGFHQPGACRIEFYLRQPPPEAGGPEPASFRKVDLTLPPPVFLHQGQLAGASRRAPALC